MKIPVSEPIVGEQEIQYALDALKSGWISGLKGKYLDKFESNFSRFCNVNFGVACSSGTAALQVATRVLDLGPGDEVIVPTFTNIASILCLYYNGAKPILVDVDPDTWCMDTNLINGLISSKTKALLPVHIYGHPVDMDKINAIAKENNLFVIEDCAEGHGAEIRGKKAGGLSDVSCFSFYSNKIISTGEGGMILTNNEGYAKKARQLVTLAFSDKNRYQHEYLAYNFRLSNLLAAIGVAQLENIDSFIEKKRWIASEYNKQLKHLEGIEIPVEKEWAKNVYWMYGIVLNEKFPIDRDQLMKFLGNHGVDSRSFFVPMHNQHIFHKKGLFLNEQHPQAERISKNGLYLPCSNRITIDEINYICEIIKKASEN